MASATGTRTNEPETLNPRRQILDVAPLNSVPYIGPPLFDTDTNTNTPSTEPKNDTGDSVEKLGPAMIYCPLVTRLEWNNIVAATKTGIALTGAAAMGKVGPVLGSMDVGESKDSFFFRVSLPGVAGDEKEFSCDIEPDGKVTIKGVTTTGEKIVCKNSQVFKMQSQNLCPPGYFSLSFQLPGPVKHQQFSGVFTDGILEGVVTKMEINNV